MPACVTCLSLPVMLSLLYRAVAKPFCTSLTASTSPLLSMLLAGGSGGNWKKERKRRK